jgi:hypothetical protein
LPSRSSSTNIPLSPLNAIRADRARRDFTRDVTFKSPETRLRVNAH